ncbi:MAG: Folate-binding protein [Actinomycetota bacterium]|nr:Folate-binding protein [Actinomycetota bacterium]
MTEPDDESLGANGYRSPAMALPGAVPAPPADPDQGVPWHYGDPHAEQRRLVAGQARVDQSHLAVLEVTGSDRLSWLNSLLTAKVDQLAPGGSAAALVLDPNGHVEHELHLVEHGHRTLLIVEPDRSAALLTYLDRMRFMLDVAVREVTADLAVLWSPTGAVGDSVPAWVVPAEFAGRGMTESGSDRGGDAAKYVRDRPGVLVGAQLLIPRQELLAQLTAAGPPAGSWALAALRVAAAVPRIGQETDHRSIPHELGWIGPAVHLAKGCYRGQETIARVHNMGRPPRRLVLLHLDGSVGILPAHGDPVRNGDKVVGWIGTAAWHYESGPIATAVIKRATPADVDLTVASADGLVAATQQLVVEP